MSILDKPQLAALAIGKGYRRIKRSVYNLATSLTGFSSLVPKHISRAPTYLRTADPVLAQEYYRGRYAFAGKVVETGGKSPFMIKVESKAWEKKLHGFEWLRHLSASNDPLSPNHARALITDWIELHKKSSDPVAWDVEIASLRLISLLCNSVIITANVEHDFYRLFMRNLGAHVRFLRREVTNAPEGMPKLYAYIALAYASVCHEGQASSLEQANTRLARELSIQVLADGGHISRNPACIIEILTLLLPLKQACTASGIEPPSEMLKAIERLLPALRYYQMGDGNLARFNGVGFIELDLVATLLRYDESAGQPIQDASQSGYQRMTVGNSILLMDTGEPPKGELSKCAHAGCLSFEFSNAAECIIINCGTPKAEYQGNAPLWRATAAHSTAVLNETSSCKFETSEKLGRFIDGQIYSANLKTQSSRNDTSDSSTVTASHHGYVRDFGVRHQRKVTLCDNGNRLNGDEWFSTANKGDLRHTTKDDAKIRFHLGPDVKASLSKDGHSCLLETRSGQQWAFSAPGFEVKLEESIFFSSLTGTRPTWQIVIHAKLATTPEVKWVLQKLQPE